MAKIDNSIMITVQIKPDLSWRDALKLRLAGGKHMEKFWDAFAEMFKSGEKTLKE